MKRITVAVIFVFTVTAAISANLYLRTDAVDDSVIIQNPGNTLEILPIHKNILKKELKITDVAQRQTKEFLARKA